MINMEQSPRGAGACALSLLLLLFPDYPRLSEQEDEKE